MNLIQKALFKGSQKISISDDGKVKVDFKNIEGSKTNSFDLFKLDSEFESYSKIHYNYLIYFALGFLPGIILCYEGIMKGDDGIIWLGVIFIFPSFLGLYYFIKKQLKVTFVKFRQNDSYAFSIWKNNPSKSVYEEFLHNLKSKIDDSQSVKILNSEEKLNVCVKYIEFLVNLEVMSHEEANELYERAKEKLINKKAELYSISNDEIK